MKVIVYSKKHSVRCYDEERRSCSDSGLLGWVTLEPEILWEGEMANILREGELLEFYPLNKPPGTSPVRERVTRVEYFLPPNNHVAQSVILRINWYDQEKMSALIKEKEKS